MLLMLFAIFSKFECYSKSMGLDHGYLWYLIMVDYGTSSWLKSYVWFLIMVHSKSMVRFHCWFKKLWYLFNVVQKFMVFNQCCGLEQNQC